MSSQLAAAAGQAIIASITPFVTDKDGNRVKFIIDGRWGSTTQKSYNALAVGDRMKVDAVVTAAGSTTSQLVQSWGRDKWAGNGNVVLTVGKSVSAEDVLSALVSVLRSKGVSSAEIEVLASRKLLELESGIRGGKADPLATNPKSSASGLFQYILSTWNAYASKVAGAKTYSSIPAFQTATRAAEPGSPGDWKVAVAVHAAALMDTAEMLKRARLPLTVGTMYTIHNQGAPVGLDYLKGKRSFNQLTNLANQSNDAKNLIREAMTQVA